MRAVHLLYIHNFLHGALITGSLILQGQQIIFSGSILHEGLYSDHTCMGKRQCLVRKLDYMKPLRFQEADHGYTMQVVKIIGISILVPLGR
jgi:hypothetical protein